MAEKIADLKKIKFNDIFLVSFESRDCEVEFCFFGVAKDNTNPNYVFTAGYLNFTISQRFKLQLIDENIGYVGVISDDKRTTLEWCVPIIFEKLKTHLCEKNAENYVNELLGEPRAYRKNSSSKRGSRETVVDLTERDVTDRINNPEVLEQFRDEIECSSIESGCCDIPIVYDKELKTWFNGWDEQCIKIKTVNRESILNWIESSDFTIIPYLKELDVSDDDNPSCSTATSEIKPTSSFVPTLKPFTKEDPDAFKFTLPVKNESPSCTSRNMIPEHSKLFSHKDIAILNSKTRENESRREVGKLKFKTVNEQNIHDCKIPRKSSTPPAPHQRSPIRPHSTPSILSIDRSAKKYRDLLNRPSLFEHKRKNDNEDDVVFVDEVKRKNTSNDENNNGQKKHKLYSQIDDDELILIEDTEKPSTSTHIRNSFKLFTTKNNRLHGISKRTDNNHPSSSSSRSQYNSHHKR